MTIEVKKGTNGAKNKTILLVDDDKSWLTYLSILLKHPSFTLVTTTDPQYALGFLKKLRPDALVTDTNMPHMSGVDLMNQAHLIFPELPVVVFFSGMLDSPLKADDVVKAGAAHVLPKWEAENLQKLLCELLKIE